MSTEQQFQLNVHIKEEMDELETREKRELLDNMAMADKWFQIKEEPLPEDDEWLSSFASKQPATPLVVGKRETCECPGDCLHCIEADTSKETMGDTSCTFESFLNDDSDRMPSDWFCGESSDSDDEGTVDEASVASADSVSNFPIKAEPFPEYKESLSPFASPRPASPSIVIKGETCPCTGDCLDCQSKRSPPCPECGKTFANNGNLNVHLRVHTGERPYVCSQCPKAFKEFGNLTRHQLTHQAVRSRPFGCTAEGCGKDFPTKPELTRHHRSHTGHKPYRCANCGKAFTQSGQLTVHFRRHTGDKPYKCANCGKSCITSSHLTVHLRSHTGERPYRCPLCPKAFAQSSNAKAHLRAAHPSSP